MQVEETEIPGVMRIVLDVFGDQRGSFQEVWQNEKLGALGFPALNPVQCNVCYSTRGVLRGIHAEPWDKYIYLAAGRATAAIVDLRPDSPTAGHHQTFELDQGFALFLPKGMGNSYQVTSREATYLYLVNAHWQAGLAYGAVRYDDPDLAIRWPITGDELIVSEKDRKAPSLREAFPELVLNPTL